ncbi:MAG: hypothetical protein JO032_16980 [Alphaproteobacteria bacterium]|nr:hypothetical protein [Alphaproteobacteria bacterium]MBV9554477.1 hypothetical protein [Alphaproteobacteria bacterium]
MAEAAPFFPPFTEEQNQELTVIWDKLYQLYLEKANGDRPIAQIDADIDKMIKRRDAIRSWGWDTGRDWRKDIPPEVLNKPREG